MAGKNGSGPRSPIVMAAVLAVLGVATAAILLVPPRTASGQVTDGATGRPLPGAVLEFDGRQVAADDGGGFSLPGVRPWTSVAARARGYQPASAVVGLDGVVQLALAPRVLEGVAVDAAIGRPLPGVRLSAGSLTAESDPAGRFRLVGLEPGTRVEASAEGFEAAALEYDGRANWNLALEPNVLVVRVANRYSGQPLEGVEVSDGRSVARTDVRGEGWLLYLRQGDRVSVVREGFAPAWVSYSGQASVDLQLRPDTVSGVVNDAQGRPVAGATVSDGNSTAITDASGAFRLTGVPENARLAVSARGYERRQIEPGQQTSVEVVLKPFAAMGLYLTYYGVGDDGLRNHVLELADTTEVNAVVIDVKGDRGWLAYRSSVPMVREIGAQQEIMIPDPKRLLADLRSRGVYTIARIVVFKDKPLTTARPDLAVVNAETGKPWVDNEGLTWADASREEVWDYNIALAVEAIELGFDEVQWDYVRFPTDAGAGNSLDSIRFSVPNTEENRMKAINGFLARGYRAIKARGGNVSADVFGYVVWREGDMGIGQKLEEVAKHVDYVSPMVYPNLFWDGIAVDGGVKYANRQAGLYPYEIVYESMKVAARRIGAEKLRPWLQYYDDYLTGKGYTAADVVAQKRAAYDNGISGWLFWDPSNRFAKGGFEPR